MRKVAFVILLFLALLTKSWAAAYTSFVNVTMPRDADVSMVACIKQDSNGLVWLGTNCGLFSYDGFIKNSLVHNIPKFVTVLPSFLKKSGVRSQI